MFLETNTVPIDGSFCWISTATAKIILSTPVLDIRNSAGRRRVREEYDRSVPPFSSGTPSIKLP